MSKPEVFSDWCDKPEVVRTGNGWGVRINGCDVFDSVNQYGVKPLRSFDLVKGLSSMEEAEVFLHSWLIQQLPNMEAARAADKARIAELESALGDLLAIVSDSTGVAGYHLNGAVAEWGDFDVVSAASAALAQQGKESEA